MKTLKSTFPMDRRAFLKVLGGASLALPFSSVFTQRAIAAPSPARAKRLIVFYFPDGVPSPEGQASLWHARGGETNFTLAEACTPLAPFRDKCVFFNGLTMGDTDVGSHPGGAKKLLTGVDGGGGESIDRYLARKISAGAPFSHVYLGAMATHNNASGDKFVSYPQAGTTAAPEDDPLRAFQRLFANGAAGASGGAKDDVEASVIDASLADLNDVRARLGDAEKQKLDLHLESLREVEKRVKGVAATPPATCAEPRLDTSGFDANTLFEPAKFPAILRAQIDVMVQAMACGLTKVGVIQASQHTSELIMSRFPGTDLEKPGSDMRSHQASHYGQSSDSKFVDFTRQRKWFVDKFAYLLGELQKRPEDGATMLDHSLVLLCTEVSDGNTHRHDNMPFVLAGGGGGAVRTGRLLTYQNRRHSELLLSLARAMGDDAGSFGQECKGTLPGLLT